MQFLSCLFPATSNSIPAAATNLTFAAAPDEFIKVGQSSQDRVTPALGRPVPTDPSTVVLLPPLDDVARNVGEELRMMVTNHRRAAENSRVQAGKHQGPTKVDFVFSPDWHRDLKITAGTYDFRTFTKWVDHESYTESIAIAHGLHAAYARMVESGAYDVSLKLTANTAMNGIGYAFDFEVKASWPADCHQPILPILSAAATADLSRSEKPLPEVDVSLTRLHQLSGLLI